MPIVIPSKNIFRKENQKVINNRISGISVNQNEVKLTTRNLMEFNAKMFAEESANLLWIGYLKYTNQLGALNIENVSYGGITTLNGIYCAIINITVSSGQYIYTPSISVDLSMQYRRGESYEKSSSSRPAMYSNELLTDTTTISVNSLKAGEDRVIISAYNTVPAIHCKLTASPITTDVVKAKQVRLQLFVPLYYNPQYTERTNTQDSIVFTDFRVVVKGDELNYANYETHYGEASEEFKLQYNEFFQYYDAENKIGGYDKGTYLKRSNENVSVAKHLSEQIIGEYNDGKETATILCSIADYFSDGGSISISTKTQKMSFNIGDKTIPMVYGFDGQDHPMSNYMDGTPKVFRVVGLKFIYDGAVWQELTLQEV